MLLRATDGGKSFGRLLLDLSATFVALDAEEVEGEIFRALDAIGWFLGVDRAIVCEFAKNAETSVVRHSWASPGVQPIKIGRLMGPALPQVFARVRQGQIASIPDTSTLPLEWEVDQTEFLRSGAKSHLSIPFSVAGNLVGVFTVVSVRDHHEWREEEIELLGLLAHVFANALKRRDSERELRSAFNQVEKLKANLDAENVYLRREVEEIYPCEDMIGNSVAFQRVLMDVHRAAPTNAPILIQGETGTGKELIARSIHAQSSRSKRPLIRLSCAALPSTLAESEFFGHEKGAFTGAVGQRIGRFELADGGTIFLDEVGDLPLEIQAKLLRVLQEGEFERVGSSATRSIDVRVIAATGRNLEQDIDKRLFRADLYYRLRVIPIELPPLRNRRDDIPLLVWYFVEKSCALHGKKIRDIPPSTMDALLAYDWPGNVRELEHLIERSIILSQGFALELSDPLISANFSRSSPESGDGQHHLDTIERSHIISVLDQCGWRVKGQGNAAERLGINPSTLRGRMRRLGIERPRPVGGPPRARAKREPRQA